MNEKYKKVLILAGSPCKGENCDLLYDEFLRGARESSNIVEKIFVRDKIVVACGYCVEYEGVCVLQDGMADILGKCIGWM